MTINQYQQQKPIKVLIILDEGIERTERYHRNLQMKELKVIEHEASAYLTQRVWLDVNASMVTLTRLTGTTNFTFLAEPPADTAHRPLVVKKLAAGNKVITRQVEQLIIKEASIQGLCPRVVLQEDGWRVQQYIAEARCLTSQDFKDWHTVDQIVRKMVQYHRLQVPELKSTRPMIELAFQESYTWQKVKEAGQGWCNPTLLSRLQAHLLSGVHLTLMANPGQPKICHNDLNPLNILTNSRQVFLIDIQYSNYNYVEYDLANFMNQAQINYMWGEQPWFKEAVLDKSFQQKVVKKYLQQKAMSQSREVDDQQFLTRVRKFRAVSHLGWACWAVLFNRPDVQFNYQEYAQFRLNKYEQTLKALQTVVLPRESAIQ